jgi:hypothetical protein
MGELADAAQSAIENGAGATALNIGDDTDAAGIVFVVRGVKPLRSGQLMIETESRHVSLTILEVSAGARVGIILRVKAFR